MSDSIPTQTSEEKIEDQVVNEVGIVEEEGVEETQIDEQINSRQAINRQLIRELKKYRKINKYMMGGRDFNEATDVVLDDDGNEIETEHTRGENKWPLLELSANPTGALEKLLIVACLEEFTENDPTWVYMNNEPTDILKRIKEWCIKNHKSVLQVYEIGSMPYVIELCKKSDEKWGRWKYLSYSTESTEPEFLEKVEAGTYIHPSLDNSEDLLTITP